MSSKVSGILEKTFPEVVHNEKDNTIYKHATTCMSTLLTLKLLFVLSEFQLCQSAVCNLQSAFSPDFVSKEYYDLVKFQKQAEDRISAMEKSLAIISSRVNNLAWVIDQAQDYSYYYNVKLVGVPDIKPREND